MSLDIDDINIGAPGDAIGTIARAEQLLKDAGDDTLLRQDALQEVLAMLHRQHNIIRKAEEIKAVAKMFGYKTTQIEKFLKDYANHTRVEIDPADGEAPLPAWCNAETLYANGFVQLNKPDKHHKIGIYFKGKESPVTRVSNFTIHPLIHIMDQFNNRRIIEINNGRKKSRVEVPGRALVTKGLFEATIIDKGSYLCEGMTELQFKRVVGWLTDEMPICYDLVSLGWQPDGKGFFAYANKVYYNGGLQSFNELGVVEVGETHYISMGISNIHSDFRKTDNPYENDLYLQYAETDVTFEQWSAQFLKVYGSDNGTIGIAFVFITLFKDIVTGVTKCPHLYPYGPKGSGKSDFAESLTWLFFSGKNAEGNLMPGLNLNFGQITPFAFYNSLARFSNCPMLLNEFDEQRMEDWKFGTIKSAYDGEGRVVGDGDTGKAKKSKTQKVRGTLIIVGQYLSTGDDGSVLSRSFPCQFTLSRLDKLTATDMVNWDTLKKWEKNGLSGIICELLQYRAQFADQFRTAYWKVYEELKAELERMRCRAETRLLRNYSAALASIYIMESLVTLPFKYQDFFTKCVRTVADHNSLLKENNALAKFWKIVEYCFTRNMINFDPIERKHVQTDYTISLKDKLTIKRNGQTEEISFATRQVIVMRFNLVYAAFSKAWREQQGTVAPSEGTILKYLQDQPYYIGLVHGHYFHNTNTSGFAFNYDIISQEVVLQPHANQTAPDEEIKFEKHEKTDTDVQTPF